LGKVILGVVVALAFIVGLGWILQYNDVLQLGFFAPRYEAVRRNTFEQSRAFNEGMQQELQRMRQDYITAPDENARAALRTIVLHRVADYDLNQIKDPTLTAWILDLRRGS
jgi:hypothetical protein